MGMYTEFVFQGEKIVSQKLPKNIIELFSYFFDKDTTIHSQDVQLPDHPFFKCSRWDHIGHMSSYYFNPFALRYSQKHVLDNCGEHVFLLCNLKNYGNEIKLFLDWVDPYMDSYWGHHWYEEDDAPTFFKVRR